MKQKVITSKGIVECEANSYAHISTSLFFMSQFSFLSWSNWERLKKEVIDTTNASSLEHALMKFVETAVAKGLSEFYVHTGAGEIWRVKISL
jgi:hypothetical protein